MMNLHMINSGAEELLQSPYDILCALLARSPDQQIPAIPKQD
jgi:hypothetical protein